MMEVVAAKSYEITRCEDKNGILLFYSEAGVLRIIPQNGGIVRVSFSEEAEFSPEQGRDYDGFINGIKYKLMESSTSFFIKSSEGQIIISKKTGAVSFENDNGTLLLKERAFEPRFLEKITLYQTVGNLKVEEIETADGLKKRVKEAEKRECGYAYKTRNYFCFDEDEILLGLGQGEHGEWNLRNTTYYGHQGNRKISIPFMISSKNYGILLSTESLFMFEEKDNEAYLQTEADFYLDYFFLFGDNLFDVVKNFRRITGKAAMLPNWAYGYIQSKERYQSQKEILDTAKEFRKRKIGVDCLVLDWLSWPDGQWGQKSFDKKRFPDPKKMTAKLHEMGIHFMMSIWPNMSQGTADNTEFMDAGLLFPGTDVYNAFEKAGRDIYWKQIEKSLYPAGVDGWWCDSSEPITPEWGHIIEPSAGEKYCEYKKDADNIMPFERANSYGKYHALGIWENQRKQDHDKRVVNLTRSGWAGSQKYGTILWSGDISASWQCLRNQVRAGLQIAASGMPYWTMDTGAFFVKKGRNWFWNGQYPDGITEEYKKLYVRWLEFAAFLPVFRAHGTDIEREPWAFGDEGNRYYEAICKTIELRYQLMPYIYSVGALVCLEDGTFIRPLLFDFGNDKKARYISDQYMFGPSIMVCPVVDDQNERNIYLPEGTKWYDFYTKECYKGGQDISYKCPLDKIPLFVKEGSIIPMKKPELCTRDMNDNAVDVSVYPGCDGSFRLYEDSGDGYGYEKGNYHIKSYYWNEEKQELTEDYS